MKKLTKKRLFGIWLTSFLTPLMGATLAFNLPFRNENIMILVSSLIISSIIVGLVIAKELENGNGN